jgi:hypothetical protein
MVAAVEAADAAGVRHEEPGGAEYQDRQDKKTHERDASAAAETESPRKSRA